MGSKKNAWLKFDDAKKQEIFHFCEGYKMFFEKCYDRMQAIAKNIAKESQ